MRAIKWLPGIALAFACAAWAQAPVRLILFPGGANLPVWVAQERGFFSDEGLEVKVTPTPNSVFLVRSLMGGEQDIALAAFDNVVAYQEGQGEVALQEPPDLFSFMGITRGTVRLVVDPAIRTFADLKGKALAVDAVHTGYSLALRKILQSGGLGEDDYRFETLGGTGLRAKALMEGRTSGTILNTPLELGPEAKGFRRLANLFDVVGPYQSTTGVARRSWAASHHDTVMRFTRAMARALDWIFAPDHREEAVAIYRAHVKGATAQQASAALAAMTDAREGFARGGALDGEGMANVLKIREEFGKPSRRMHEPAFYIDESFLREARAAR